MTELVREQVLERELAKIKPTTKRTQQIAFVFAFLALGRWRGHATAVFQLKQPESRIWFK